MLFSFVCLILLGLLSATSSFVVLPRPVHTAPLITPALNPLQTTIPVVSSSSVLILRAFPANWIPGGKIEEEVTKLVVDDELWGLAISLGDIVRESIWECATHFKFRPDQLAVEIDKRVKKEIAKSMGKEDFNIIDFIFNLNKIAKDEVKVIAGDDAKEYMKMTDKIEGDVNKFLAMFTGKEEPDGKDIENAVEENARKRVGEFLGMERFSVENVAKEIDKKRQEFWKARLGEFWADRANDVNNMATRVITGKDTYQFGDVTAKLASNIFGGGDK